MLTNLFFTITLSIGIITSSGCGVTAFVTEVDPIQSNPSLAPELPISPPAQTSLKLIEYNETLTLNEGEKTALILFSDKHAPQNLEINWQIIGEGTDFLLKSGNTTLESGKKSFSISLDTLNDSVYNPNRNYTLRITSSNQKIENSIDVNFNVIEDDPQYFIRFGSSSASTIEGQPALQIPVIINTPHTNSLNIEYLVTGSATSNIDYIITQSGLIQLPAGQTQANIELFVPEDFVVESPKNVILSLYRVNEINVNIDTPSQITIQINDNDLAISPLSASVLTQDSLQFIAQGGNGQFTYTIMTPTSSQINNQGLLTTGNTGEILTVRIQDGNGLFAESQIHVIDPKSNPQLGLWLKADSLTLNDNDQVSNWLDETSNSRNFIQNTSSARPLYITNQLNNKPVIRFDGVNDVLTSSYVPVTSNNPRSITTVITNLFYKINSAVYSWGGTYYWGDAFGLIVMTQSNDSFIGNTFGTYLHSNTAYPSSRAIASNLTPYIITHQYDGTKLHYFINGEAKGTSTHSAWTKSDYKMRIGSNFNTGFFKGDIAEIFVHQEQINSTEREGIECYLGRKYNISVTTSLNCSNSHIVLPYDGNLSLSVNQTHSIQVNGGQGPFAFKLLSGNSQIDPITGLFTSAATPGVNRIRVEDNWGNGAELNVYVNNFPRPLSWIDLSLEENLIPNQNISFLKDKSGRKNNWAQRTTANQPIYLSNHINSLPAIQFSGNQFLSGSFLPPTSALTRTFAIVLSEAESGVVMDYGGSINCGTRFAFKVNSANNNLQMDRQCLINSSSAINLAENQIVIVKYTGTQLQMRRNGVPLLSITTGLSTSTNYGIRIGSSHTGNSSEGLPYLTGKIAEVIAFDSSLTNEEQTAVENYLSNKFNIPLP